MQEAFLVQAMNRHGDAVYRLALCRLQNLADAEDVYQETFLQFFQQKNAQSWEDEHLKAWLLRVAVNKCADIGRRRKANSCVALDDIPELSGKDCFAYMELWDAVNHLPEKPRMIFHLFYSEGYKTEEISEILKIPASTVRVNLNRARKAIRKELEDSEDVS
ncbi:MAG: sigma-70 family RNA polymerase sigma factor [Eubacteriales bacterium]|nr:sigma-70 family RNA polymerase sigma factor [Eubacteriales bacterium]